MMIQNAVESQRSNQQKQCGISDMYRCELRVFHTTCKSAIQQDTLYYGGVCGTLEVAVVYHFDGTSHFSR
jgi:hypothetical protein